MQKHRPPAPASLQGRVLVVGTRHRSQGRRRVLSCSGRVVSSVRTPGRSLRHLDERARRYGCRWWARSLRLVRTSSSSTGMGASWRSYPRRIQRTRGIPPPRDLRQRPLLRSLPLQLFAACPRDHPRARHLARRRARAVSGLRRDRLQHHSITTCICRLLNRGACTLGLQALGLWMILPHRVASENRWFMVKEALFLLHWYRYAVVLPPFLLLLPTCWAQAPFGSLWPFSPMLAG